MVYNTLDSQVPRKIYWFVLLAHPAWFIGGHPALIFAGNIPGGQGAHPVVLNEDGFFCRTAASMPCQETDDLTVNRLTRGTNKLKGEKTTAQNVCF